MLGRIDGKVVLVAGGIPGERVRVEIERTASQVMLARVVEVIDASPDRRQPVADPACGGLTYAHVQYERQRHLKSELIMDAFRRVGRIGLDGPIPVVASPERGYRLRARLHVRDRKAGFFREHTHELCAAEPTGQLLPASHAAIDAVLARLGPRTDLCDAIVLAENVRATERVLHLEPRPGRELDLSGLAHDLPVEVSGITTAVEGRTQPVAGASRIVDTAADIFGDARPDGLAPDLRWTRGPESFFQGNRYVLGALMREVVDRISSGPVIDLYAGVGLFAVAAAARGLDVLAIEGDRISVADLRLNARAFPALVVQHGAVEQVLFRVRPGAGATVLLDPPRTGLSKPAVEAILRLEAPRLVYVSCDVPTLARDAARIVAAGYRLEGVRAFDMFPGTAHVETVAVFQR